MSTLDFTNFLSREAKRRTPSKLKSSYKLQGSDYTYLAGGLPLPRYFAWNSFTATSTTNPQEDGLLAITNKENELGIYVSYDDDADSSVTTALQYGHTKGLPPLLDFLREHTKIIHNIPNEDWDIVTNVGSTHGWYSCLRTFCDEGDTILVEKFCFAAALEAAALQGVQTVPVEIDDLGIIPEKLDARLTEIKANGGKIPKLLYTIPTGQNPTGSTIPKERREAVYKIAQKFNFLIVEDEPYYFLQLDEYIRKEERGKSVEYSNEEFLQKMVPTFLSLDVDGRVIRMDSFSKVLAPGARVGWITANKFFVEKFVLEYETSIQSASGFSSAVISNTLKKWGQYGYIDWLRALRKEYTSKRDIAIDACIKHLSEDFVKINIPNAGMFFTISIDTSKHPKFDELYQSVPILVEAEILKQAIETFKTVLFPGSWFEVKDQSKIEKPNPVIFFRGTYAATERDVLELGIERFGNALRTVFGSS